MPRRTKWFIFVVVVTTLWTTAVATAVLAAQPAPAAEATARLEIRTDRTGAVYAQGETATFLVELSPAQQAAPPAGATLEADCELSTDAFRHSEKSRITLADGKARVTAARDFPCILWIRVTYKEGEGKSAQALAGAAFSPEEIAPSMPAPPDFDAFWAAQKALLHNIPPNPQIEPIASKDSNVELFSVTMDGINQTKIYGYLARPKGEGPFPAYFQPQWAGVYSLEPAWVTSRAQQGFLSLNINAHPIENGRPVEYYNALREGALKDYPYQGRDSRDACYFLRMYLSCCRAVEYLASRPDWDRKHLVVSGDSQGGGQAIVTAALDPHVTAVVAGEPALCDHTAMLADRAPGWPGLVLMKDGKPDQAQLEVAWYFDVVNFARQVKVPAIVGVGFADMTCPASSVYAAYNVLAGPKRMVIDPLAGHVGQKPNWSKESWSFFLAHGKD
jgi:cephalosporin-C deacetylase